MFAVGWGLEAGGSLSRGAFKGSQQQSHQASPRQWLFWEAVHVDYHTVFAGRNRRSSTTPVETRLQTPVNSGGKTGCSETCTEQRADGSGARLVCNRTRHRASRFAPALSPPGPAGCPPPNTDALPLDVVQGPPPAPQIPLFKILQAGAVRAAGATSSGAAGAWNTIRVHDTAARGASL